MGCCNGTLFLIEPTIVTQVDVFIYLTSYVIYAWYELHNAMISLIYISLQREAKHSSPSIAEVRNVTRYISMLSIVAVLGSGTFF
jgi:hypothetical protein